jgi:branched-chain amino acid transport system substrate-binding protein
LNPSAKPIVEAFRAINYEPEGYTLYNYAAIQVFAQAVRKAGSVDPQKLLAALHSNTFATVRGDIRFDSKGDVEGPSYVVYRWSDGQYSYAEDVIAEAAATEPPPSTTLP